MVRYIHKTYISVDSFTINDFKVVTITSEPLPATSKKTDTKPESDIIAEASSNEILSKVEVESSSPLRKFTNILSAGPEKASMQAPLNGSKIHTIKASLSSNSPATKSNQISKYNYKSPKAIVPKASLSPTSTILEPKRLLEKPNTENNLPRSMSESIAVSTPSQIHTNKIIPAPIIANMPIEKQQAENPVQLTALENKKAPKIRGQELTREQVIDLVARSDAYCLAGYYEEALKETRSVMDKLGCS
jgi:hypothetical protein